MSDTPETAYPAHVMTWGPGGYDPEKENNNLVDDYWVDETGNRVDPPAPEPAMKEEKHHGKEDAPKAK